MSSHVEAIQLIPLLALFLYFENIRHTYSCLLAFNNKTSTYIDSAQINCKQMYLTSD